MRYEEQKGPRCSGCSGTTTQKTTQSSVLEVQQASHANANDGSDLRSFGR